MGPLLDRIVLASLLTFQEVRSMVVGVAFGFVLLRFTLVLRLPLREYVWQA